MFNQLTKINMQNNFKTITLDFTFEPEGQLLLINFCKKHNILFCIKKWVGPAGGNPELSFTGTEQSIAQLEHAYNNNLI